MLNAMFEAANSVSPSLPISNMKAEKAAISRKNWTPLGNPYLISLLKRFSSNFQPDIVLYFELFSLEKAN